MARYRDRHGDELYRTGVGGPRSSSSEPGPLRLHVLARRTFRPLHATHSCSRESQQPPKFDGSLRSVHPPVPRLISPAGVTDPSSSLVSFPRRARLSVLAANLEFRITYRHTVRESLVRDHGQLSSSPCAQPARCTKVLSRTVTSFVHPMLHAHPHDAPFPASAMGWAASSTRLDHTFTYAPYPQLQQLEIGRRPPGILTRPSDRIRKAFNLKQLSCATMTSASYGVCFRSRSRDIATTRADWQPPVPCACMISWHIPDVKYADHTLPSYKPSALFRGCDCEAQAVAVEVAVQK